MLSEWWGKVRRREGRLTIPTRFGEATVYTMPDGDGSLVRMLNVGGVLQSATYTDERWAVCPFAYLRAFDHLFEAADLSAPRPLTVGRVLMIGGAGFAYPKSLLVNHPGVRLDVVEIDPAMVALAREHFCLDRLEALLAVEGRADDLRIFVEDGAAFLRGEGGAAGDRSGTPGAGGVASRPDALGTAGAGSRSGVCDATETAPAAGPHDVIINDAFVGREPVAFFASDEGIAAAKARLTPGGLLMANCVAEFTGNAMYQLFSQVERLREHFANVYVIDAADEQFGGADNYLVIATDGTYPFTNVIPYGD